MDTDLEQMTREELIAEVRKLRQGIREHRDSSRHDLCWHQPSLWGLLPEKTDPLPVVPEWPEFMRGCVKYRQSLDEQGPTRRGLTNRMRNDTRAAAQPMQSQESDMRKLIASTFTSLDGVMQAPGGPDEDPTGNFTLGGWLFPFMDAGMDLSAAGFDGKDRELVLGRRTYEIFEAYWPYQPEDDPIARTLNAAKKHVASRTLKSLQWNNSSVLGGDVVSAIAALKAQSGHDLQIIGSGNLIQTLHAASLIDEYNIWTFPVVLGRGKRLFENGARPCALRLVASKVSKTDVVMSTYVPAGDVQPGSFGHAELSAKELARRAKITSGEWI